MSTQSHIAKSSLDNMEINSASVSIVITQAITGSDKPYESCRNPSSISSSLPSLTEKLKFYLREDVLRC